ncbi:MAG: hypothetical protein Q3983_07685 [Capnocytophaga sp.]|nr:hypothetical protein [Capnocytophaga sp.]
MKPNKLPFNIQLERKYNEINSENFLLDWQEDEPNRTNRVISMSDDLQMELGKFNAFGINLNEIIDIGLRYALRKREFRRMIAQLITYKGNHLKIYN